MTNSVGENEAKRVPKVVIQTVRSVHDMSEEAKRTAAAARNWADEDGYVYLLFGNEECEQFSRAHASSLPTNAVEAWKMIKPGAFKADLFRYAYLYIKGGVYLDVGHVPLLRIRDLLMPNKPFTLAMASEWSEGGVGAHQAILMAAPNCRVMRAALELGIQRVETKQKGHSELWITGPICLHDAMQLKLGFYLPRTVPRGKLWTPWGTAMCVLYHDEELWTTPSKQRRAFRKNQKSTEMNRRMRRIIIIPCGTQTTCTSDKQRL